MLQLFPPTNDFIKILPQNAINTVTRVRITRQSLVNHSSLQLSTILPVNSPLSINSCAFTHSRALNTLCTCRRQS